MKTKKRVLPALLLSLFAAVAAPLSNMPMAETAGRDRSKKEGHLAVAFEIIAEVASMHLLNTGQQPTGRSVLGFDEVPDFLEAARRLARDFAHEAGEPHACPMLAALGNNLEQIGVQGHHVRELLHTAACGNVRIQ